MMTAPNARRQIVGDTLRRYRENVGCTLADAALALDCHPSKISRVETGERGLRTAELAALLHEYEADEDARAALMAIASPGGSVGWWSGHLLSPAEQDYLTLETLSSQAFYYAPLQVPELLQAPPYAEAAAEASQGLVTGATPNHAVEALLARQEAILDGTRDIQAVISEAALHQAVGSSGVMRQQAAHLAGLAETGQVDLQVMPFAALAHPAPASGSMAILRIGAISIACLPGITASQFMTGADAALHVRAWEQLRACALSGGESARLLRKLAAA